MLFMKPDASTTLCISASFIAQVYIADLLTLAFNPDDCENNLRALNIKYIDVYSPLQHMMMRSYAKHICASLTFFHLE